MSLNAQRMGSIGEALHILPAAMNTLEAWVMLMAIGLQESRFEHRRQIVQRGKQMLPVGPAKGFWQFEKGGGVRGVLTHKASRYWAHLLCRERGVKPESLDVWNAIENDDVLAAGFARLLLFTDPKRLPSVKDADSGWDLYLRTWRPGKPHPETWVKFHAQANEALSGVSKVRG